MAVRRRLQRRRRRHNAVPRRLNDRSKPLENLNEAEVFDRYRFVPETIMFIVSLMREELIYQSHRNNPLTPLYQVLVALRIFATGSFYITIGDTLIVSKSSAGRAVRRVTDSLCSHAKQFIRPPGRDEISSIKNAFHKLAGFPGVIGCVDGLMIKIVSPSENEADYLCRKGFYALNVQMTCDPQFKVLDIFAKWPGSVHDSRIFKESNLCGFLLGDSGYGLKPYLLTPYIAEDAPGNRRYNAAHCRTRVTIEQTFVIMKKRFHALHCGLRTKPDRACRIVTACTILHNIGIQRRDILRVTDFMNGNDVAVDVHVMVPEDAVGRTVRDHVRDTYFL